MAAPSGQQLIAALDIGSSKVSALIVTPGPDGRLTVLGTGQRESRGVKRGYITDMLRTTSDRSKCSTRSYCADFSASDHNPACFA